MKLLLTGVDGFTGSHFSNFARLAGHEVIPLCVNLTDREALRQEIFQVAPDLVVHLAGISFVGHANLNAFYEVNVIGTMNLLDALVALPKRPERVLLASSANIYGNCSHSPITEEQVPAPVNHYAASKLAMEHMARTYLGRLPLFFTRPFNYTGVGQNESFVVPKIVSHFLQRAKSVELGNLRIEREFNDVRFVCEAYLRLLDKAQIGEAYNICTGIPMPLMGVIDLLSAMTGHTIEIKVNPAFVRENEVQLLCGSNAKLVGAVGELMMPPLEETLAWMLNPSANSSIATDHGFS